MVKLVKDPVLSLQQLRLQLWQEFEPWPRDFHMPRCMGIAKKKKKNGDQKAIGKHFLSTKKKFINLEN